VKELIALGAISSLCKNIAPSEPMEHLIGVRMLKEFKVLPKSVHTFDEPQKDVTVAYHRDRGEDLQEARIDASIGEYQQSDYEQYGYVFTLNNEWKVVDGDKFESVADVYGCSSQE
jgi:hypothetical protein